MLIYRISIFLLINIDIFNGDLTSYFNLHGVATDFIPFHPVELRAIHLSIESTLACACLCHQDPQCRTFVFDFPICRLYESSLISGSIVVSSSMNSEVGTIDDAMISLSSSYNHSCDYCYSDRYLVCRNNRCQCPLNTYWDGQNKCLNQLFVDSTLSCKSDDWCREDINLTCQCGKCQCPKQTFWTNKTCQPQFLSGSPCNTTDQCRIDLNLTCSRTNKTCSTMTIVTIPVINGSVPAKFAYLGTVLNYSGFEWWYAFDGNRYTYWNAYVGYIINYILLSFDDQYLLDSLQLTVYGNGYHDPKTIDVYLDENGTCLSQSFSFPYINNYSYITLPSSPFDRINKPVVTKQVLLAIDRWSINQAWVFELAFFGALY